MLGPIVKEMLPKLRTVVPALSYGMHKGQAGKVGIVGGSHRYTGAPYFAAISALKMGADLATVFCTTDAGTPIKSYSPELMVHPVIPTTDTEFSSSLGLPGEKDLEAVLSAIKNVDNWLPRLDVLIIGPGLSRDHGVLRTAEGIINAAKKRDLPLVIDGDGLFLLNTDSDVIRGYSKTILTPNAMEFRRLWEGVMGSKTPIPAFEHKESEWKAMKASNSDSIAQPVCQLAKKLGVTILRKGPIDIITDGDKVVLCDQEGSPRRCGGQGDMLAGLIGTFYAWASGKAHGGKKKTEANEGPSESKTEKTTTTSTSVDLPPSLIAAYGGCFLTRYCANAAFRKHQRSTLTTNMIEELEAAVQTHFPLQSTL